MIRCNQFKQFIGKGSTIPFIAYSDRGDLFVVKAHAKSYKNKPLFTKPIFNEYVSGRLARAIDLPWPEVHIVQLIPEIILELKKSELDISSEWAVGISYIDGLDICQSRYDIQNLFSNYDAFYGKSVFDNWVLFQDLKYDTLGIKPDGSPMFLDGSMAFGGQDWNTEELRWNEYLHMESSPYLKGIIKDFALFDPWLKRLDIISEIVINQILDTTPDEWSVPEGYIYKIRELLIETSNEFIPLFREWIDWD